MLSLLHMMVTLSSIVPGQVFVTDIPSPRPTGWVVDQTGILRTSVIDEINQLCEDVNRETGGEMAVVVIPTTGGKSHREFATDLFNDWGVGQATENNGLLLFVALNDRRAEIILGNGIDSAQEVAVSQTIMASAIVPAFRSGDPNGAVVAGAWQCAGKLMRLPSAHLESPQVPFAAPASEPTRPPGRFTPQAKRRGPGALIAFWGIAGSLGLAGCAGVRKYLRYRKRFCPKCKVSLRRLNEQQDNKHLGKSQQLEESVGSVDYDVWSCPTCPHVTVLRYNAFFTSYKSCPKCSTRTMHSTSRTVSHATEHSTGSEEITEDCRNCSYRRVYMRTIPRQSSSSSSSSFGSSSSSSSSSSRSGFGGGSSSGRGASGGW